MKRVRLAIFIMGLMMFALCSCGGDNEGDAYENTETLNETDTDYRREKRYYEDGREILVYTVFEYGPMQKSLVNSFNAENEEYYIEVQNMREGNENDPMKAFEDFDLTLVNETAGDILQVNSLYYKKYIRLGAYEDLNPYMEADDEFNKADYWENVFSACEADGKLYYVPASFDVQAYVGKASVWEGQGSMTADEAVELFNNLPEGVELLFRMTRKDYVSNIMNTGMDNFVDWESGECNFESEQFKNVLRVAANLPDEYISDGNQVSMEVKYGNGEVLLAELTAMDYRELQIIKMCMQEELVVVNYPGTIHKGNVLCFLEGHTYAINSDSLSKDGAWEFIKYALSFVQQNAMEEGTFSSGVWMIPMNKEAFQRQMEKWQTPIWELNEDNEKVERPIKCFISEDIILDIYHATDEDVAFWTDIIENITTVKENNYVLTNIIMEEAGPYFSGQKSVDEVAEIIQGRISIYVNENKE